MEVKAFLEHWGITEHPFRAEEARDDPVFHRLIDSELTHPDFEKVHGRPDQPSAAVVFGEKGSGKTAMRLVMDRRIDQHNIDQPLRRVWVVRYDDLNPMLDRFAQAVHRQRNGDGDVLSHFTLADHMDAVLSLGVTRLIDALLGEAPDVPMPDQRAKVARKMPATARHDLAVLAMLYDTPVRGRLMQRWRRLCHMLRVGWLPVMKVVGWGAVLAAAASAALAATIAWTGSRGEPIIIAAALCIAVAVLLAVGWASWQWRLWSKSRRTRRAIRVVQRTAAQLRQAMGQLPERHLTAQPIPSPDDLDSRYQLTGRLLNVLRQFGYVSIVVIMDRVDEPALINGDAQRMQALVWPMLNHKFLQQDGVGVKLLLPIELRHLLHREDPGFYQQARLDKQHMIDRLVWSGPMLYDLCAHRLEACRAATTEPINLADLFDEDVSAGDLIDALDQMRQPRDAFKLLYQLIQDHCASVPQDQPRWRIARLTLQQALKQQSQRVQDLYRGLSPA